MIKPKLNSNLNWSIFEDLAKYKNTPFCLENGQNDDFIEHLRALHLASNPQDTS